MTTFDQILPTIERVFSAHADALRVLGPLLVNRDLNGRVRLIVEDTLRTNANASQALSAIASALHSKLGPHAYPADQAILYEEDLADASDGAARIALDGFENIHLVDRLATKGDWAHIAPKSAGAPRIVFFSIKGGVGRSTALAASAWALARAGKRVLVLDLDLESPGLSATLLPEERRPGFGIVDWLIEDLVGNGDAVFADMIATSPLSHNGEIHVVPAHGPNPGEYVSKLGRVWMPKMGPDGSREAWSQRLRRLIDALEARWRPDVILLDSRAGIDDVASICVTELKASSVLLFAVDEEQTWSGYRILFEHWRRHGVAQDVRQRLQMVGAMVPDDERKQEYLAGLRQRSHDLFLDKLYDETPPGDVGEDRWSFDTNETSAPHYPWAISWNRGFASLCSIHERLASVDADQVEAVFGPFIDGLMTAAADARAPRHSDSSHIPRHREREE